MVNGSSPQSLGDLICGELAVDSSFFSLFFLFMYVIQFLSALPNCSLVIKYIRPVISLLGPSGLEGIIYIFTTKFKILTHESYCRLYNGRMNFTLLIPLSTLFAMLAINFDLMMGSYLPSTDCH